MSSYAENARLAAIKARTSVWTVDGYTAVNREGVYRPARPEEGRYRPSTEEGGHTFADGEGGTWHLTPRPVLMMDLDTHIRTGRSSEGRRQVRDEVEAFLRSRGLEAAANAVAMLDDTMAIRGVEVYRGMDEGLQFGDIVLRVYPWNGAGRVSMGGGHWGNPRLLPIGVCLTVDPSAVPVPSSPRPDWVVWT